MVATSRNFEYSNTLLEYEQEQRRVKSEIWSSVNVRGLTVIDFEIGESTLELVKLRARVIGIDNDLKKLRRYKDL